MHTPGPWFAVNCGTADEPMYSVKAARIKGKEPRHEVCICATGDSPQEMETANARLISATPDLLDACELVIGSLSFDREDPFSREVIRRLSAAIAKAKGA